MKAWTLLLVVVLPSACSGQGAGEPGSPTATDTPVASAQSEGLCRHGVLEPICPKCHPSVVAVFKAKGDWCDEHGFPESVCPVCHPERGGRPSVDVSSEEAPADGTKINLRTASAVQMAGIETTAATLDETAVRVEALVRIQYDATQLAHVGAPTAGVLKRLTVDVGAPVKRGALLAVIDSVGVGADRSQLLAAEAKLKAADANLARERDLRSQGVSPERDVERAQSERDAAFATAQGARAALGVVGAAEKGGGTYTLHAPLAGVVTRRTASMGQMLTAGAMVFEIVDASTMWADIDVAERDLVQVRAGQKVEIKIDALGDRVLEGAIAFVAPVVDARTRTALARVPLANDDGALRANLFGRAWITVAAPTPLVSVPRESVQQAEGQAFVFVKTDDKSFEARRVQVERSDGDRAYLAQGLEAGETVATTGAFLLKTEILKGAIGAGCCE